MHMLNQIVGVSLPFIIAICVQIVSKQVKQFAERSIPRVYGEDTKLFSEVKDSAVSLSVYVYVHLSFFFSLIVSVATCAGDTLMTKNSVFVVIPILVLLIFIILWQMNWIVLTAKDLDGPRGRAFNRSSYISIIILWAVAVYVVVVPAT
jgi:hypothetical protein